MGRADKYREEAERKLEKEKTKELNKKFTAKANGDYAFLMGTRPDPDYKTSVTYFEKSAEEENSRYISRKDYGGKEWSVTEYTMSEIIASVYDMMEETGVTEGILFLDEINCVSETLAPMMLQFLQCKTFGNQRLPEGCLVRLMNSVPTDIVARVRSAGWPAMMTLNGESGGEIESAVAVWNGEKGRGESTSAHWNRPVE